MVQAEIYDVVFNMMRFWKQREENFKAGGDQFRDGFQSKNKDWKPLNEPIREYLILRGGE